MGRREETRRRTGNDAKVPRPAEPRRPVHPSLGDPDLDRQERERLRGLTPAEKLDMVFEISDFVVGLKRVAPTRRRIRR